MTRSCTSAGDSKVDFVNSFPIPPDREAHDNIMKKSVNAAEDIRGCESHIRAVRLPLGQEAAKCLKTFNKDALIYTDNVTVEGLAVAGATDNYTELLLLYV